MKARAKRRALIVGLTGGFAGGKSTVAGLFQELGASVIDADRLYHKLLKSNSPLYKKIISRFGRKAVTDGFGISRKKLAQLAFNSPARLKQLCRITHPVIIKEIKAEIKRLSKNNPAGIAVIDAPLLIEAGLGRDIDRLVVVKISRKKQIYRARKKWWLSAQEIQKRINSQFPLSKKIKLADYVINNNGTIKQTKKQVRKIWHELHRHRSKS